MLSEMGQYLEEAEKSRKGQMKKKLLDWGGALDLCARKEEQLRKAERLRKEHTGRDSGDAEEEGGNGQADRRTWRGGTEVLAYALRKRVQH